MQCGNLKIRIAKVIPTWCISTCLYYDTGQFATVRKRTTLQCTSNMAAFAIVDRIIVKCLHLEGVFYKFISID